jgi:hypothetical protein
VCRAADAVKEKRPRLATVHDIKEFAQRAHSILWAQGSGHEHKNFDKWKARVAELQENSGLNKSEAVVRASKEYACLNQLFREYNVRRYDPNPESHPRIKHYGDVEEHDVECEGIVQTYRESLRWAIAAAGAFSRTGEKPPTCPCDTAWYLYEQAVSDPKDFLARVGQVESKGDAEDAAKRSANAAGTRSMAEIDGMLAELECEGESDEE